jgi:glycosyltransferase involved in cell wall biosynthesis
LSPPGDARAFADALLQCSARDRVELRSAARRHFEEHLAFDVLGRGLLEAYRSLDGRRP